MIDSVKNISKVNKLMLALLIILIASGSYLLLRQAKITDAYVNTVELELRQISKLIDRNCSTLEENQLPIRDRQTSARLLSNHNMAYEKFLRLEQNLPFKNKNLTEGNYSTKLLMMVNRVERIQLAPRGNKVIKEFYVSLNKDINEMLMQKDNMSSNKWIGVLEEYFFQ